jgi:hypothetical protein
MEAFVGNSRLNRRDSSSSLVKTRARVCTSAFLLIALTACWVSQCLAQRARVVFLGSFYSESFTEEHGYQDQVDLWSEGSHVFGLTSKVAGLIGDQAPILRRFEGTRRANALELSNGFRGTLRGPLLAGTLADEPGYKIALKRSSDKMATGALRAPLASYEAWRAWADTLIDRSEERNPYIRQELAKCEQGDGWACVGIGNRLKYRKPEEAKKYWERGCELDAWAGCRFLGDSVRYQSILVRLCSSAEKPSLHRTMACEELGAAAEKAGRIDDAIRWYEIGCTPNSLPTTCCSRLRELGRQRSKATPETH